jgi:hypothetical protein
MRTTTEAQLELEQLAADQRQLHASCFGLAEAAQSVQRTREAVRQKAERHGIGHRSPWWSGRTAMLHLTLDDLHELYPDKVRGPRPLGRRFKQLSVDEAKATLGANTILPKTAEWEQSKKRRP